MQITVENAGGCKRIIRAEIPADAIATKLAEGYRDLNRQVAMPGFRKGKTPKAVLEKRFGSEVRSDVSQTLADEALRKAVDEHALKLLGRPEVVETPELKEGEAAVFTIEAEVFPEFELPEYKGLDVERPEVKVEDHEIDAVLRNHQLKRSQRKDLPEDAAAEKGQFVRGDIHVVVGEETIFHKHGGLLEVGREWIAGLKPPKAEEQLVGLKKGDHKEIPLTLPEDFVREEYRGKEAKITVDVSEVIAFEGPSMEEVSKEEGFDSLGEWKDEVRDDLRRQKESEIDAEVEDRLARKVADAANMELPEKFSEAKARDLLQQQAYRLYQSGAPEEEVRKFLESSKDVGLEGVKSQLKRAFVVEAISRKERLVVTEDELQRQVGELAAAYGQPVDAMYAELDNRGMLPGMREELKTRKVLKLLRQKAKYTQKSE